MEKKYYYIYLTTNIINGKRYIGQRSSNQEPMLDPYLGSGKYLTRAINKYKKYNFSKQIIEVVKTPEELNEREIYWIKKYNAVEDDNFYNISEGGKNPVLRGKNSPNYGKKGEKHPRYGKTHSLESLKKMSERKKGEKHHMYGKTHSLESLKKMSESQKGKPKRLESIKKRSETNSKYILIITNLETNEIVFNDDMYKLNTFNNDILNYGGVRTLLNRNNYKTSIYKKIYKIKVEKK